jgi:hypothetical protein
MDPTEVHKLVDRLDALEHHQSPSLVTLADAFTTTLIECQRRIEEASDELSDHAKQKGVNLVACDQFRSDVHAVFDTVRTRAQTLTHEVLELKQRASALALSAILAETVERTTSHPPPPRLVDDPLQRLVVALDGQNAALDPEASARPPSSFHEAAVDGDTRHLPAQTLDDAMDLDMM